MSNARRLAFEILVDLEQGDHTLDFLIEQRQAAINALERNDRALLHALVYGVQRWRLRLDWIMDQFSDRPGKKIAPPVLSALRLGLFQLYFMDRIPPSAAVNTSVELVKKSRARWAAGFVNALLRRAAAAPQALSSLPLAESDPAARLAVQNAFPHWLIRRWLERFGQQDTEARCTAMNTIPALTLRTNTLRATRERLMDTLKNLASAITPTPFSPEGICLRSPKSPANTWPSFKEGWFQIQDEAAQLISHLVAPAPGHHVWDACAGLGTKTAHLAQLMENKGILLASDHRRDKLDRLLLDFNRLGMKTVRTEVLDLSRPLPPPLPQGFDRILVDAPCSGLGVLQKNPDGKWRIEPADLRRNAQRQGAFLCNAARHLKPGGVLVYSVCSTEPEETSEVVETFLQKHQDFAIFPPSLPAIPGNERLLTHQGFLLTLPHRHAMDGFFAAALVRRPGP
ncbi:MAG: 16S rRNA (cytosine(967)-C(5))-methyltransferase RsmB [Desulfosarcinaceae bacterium]